MEIGLMGFDRSFQSHWDQAINWADQVSLCAKYLYDADEIRNLVCALQPMRYIWPSNSAKSQKWYKCWFGAGMRKLAEVKTSREKSTKFFAKVFRRWQLAQWQPPLFCSVTSGFCFAEAYTRAKGRKRG